MNQKTINQIIAYVCKIENKELSVLDLRIINQYLTGEIDYDVFVSYFDSKNSRRTEK